MSVSDQLRARWQELSLSSTWTDPDRWWSPGVDAVADALTERPNNLFAACTELGRQRADAGISLDEARDDMRLVAALARLRPTRALSTVDRLTIGWVDRSVGVVHEATCVDPLTGLTSTAYLNVRLGELRAEAHSLASHLGDQYALVVVKIRHLPDPIEREFHMVAVERALRSVFRSGETLARVGPTCAVAVVKRRADAVATALALIGCEFSIAQDEHQLQPVRFWLEPIPRDAERMTALLHDLASA